MLGPPESRTVTMAKRDPKKRRPRATLAEAPAGDRKLEHGDDTPTPGTTQAACRIPKIQEPAGRGGFVPASQQRFRHSDLRFHRRGDLHVLLTAIHRAVNRGRVDLAEFFAKSAARLVDEGGHADA